MKTVQTAVEAVSAVQSGDRIFVQGSAGTPLVLTRALESRAGELENVEVVCLSVLGDIGINKAEYEKSFYFNALFVSEPIRANVAGNNGDYIPVFLSEIHRLFEQKHLALDAALVHVSPPDQHGFCSLGVSVDVARAAVKHARRVIAQVNPQMPRTHGDGLIHTREIDYMIEVDEPLPEVNYSQKVTETERRIGYNAASLIEDGATLQAGIGTIPDAVLDCLHNHKDLGVHTEMFSDGVIRLMKSGAVNNRLKHKHRFKTATAFALGTRELYDFVDDNPEFSFLNASYVNDNYVIRSNPKVVAINSAIEIDLTGQVCADSIGVRQYSGVGGQMDFMRGAALSEGGKPIIALTANTGKGISKIVPELKSGAGVVTTRAHVHWVVTENGITNLFGKNLKQRAYELIKLAAPEHRESLEKAAFERFGK